jgi:hypothetical protein
MKNVGLQARDFVGWLLAAACLLAAVMIKPVQDRIEGRLQLFSADPDMLYFSSPEGIKKLAMGFDSLLADLYWMRAIQYYGRREEADKRPVRYKNLVALLQVATSLDPDMLEAYRAGATFLAEPDPVGAGQPEEGLKLLDKGIGRMPQEWRLWFDKGFVYFWFFKDYKSAGETWLSASRLPSSPVWMEGLAASALSKGGAMETAKALWQRQYQESARADVRENARNHFYSIQAAEALWTLEFCIAAYHGRTGTYPPDLEELVREGFLRAVPVDPTEEPYQYDRRTGEVGLNSRSKIRYIEPPPAYREDFLAKLNATVTSR